MKTWQDYLNDAAIGRHVKVAPISCSGLEDLALCPLYRRNRDQQQDMSAAHRGTALHALMCIPENDWPLDIPEEEFNSLLAARRIEARFLSVADREKQLGGGMHDFGGTADIIGHTWDGKRIVADYKFGANPVRSDAIQLIAYAFLSGAVATLVIQPGQEPHLHDVTDADLRRLSVALALARSNDPTPCDNCGTCRNSSECPALRRDLAVVSQIPDPKTIALPEDPSEAGRLLSQVDAAETICEALKARLKARLVERPDSIAGWKISKSSRQNCAYKKLAEAHCSPEDLARETSVIEVISLRRTTKGKS